MTSLIAELLNDIDDEFEPRLSERVNIEDYAKKLVEKSIILPVFIEGKLSSFISFYANDQSGKISYITMVAVRKEFRGRGLGKQVVDFALKFCQKHKMQTMRLEVDKTNKAALALYNEFGFRVFAEKDFSYIMEASL